MKFRFSKKEYIIEKIGERYTVMRVYPSGNKFKLLGEFKVKSEAVAAMAMDAADDFSEK